ncbi:T9SS type A sorting domain-containing protein [Membranicola marinus]|uniref:T9SS type A sorting domain-containing protein n=1 Tax=Membranihabitans marinus TaxID=1227546 RepID=A0A953HSP5_9BACT|nr:T9SS type A sorting domain-containing protein [Membranihabitans marinus]MBY5957680.1 T9SS type A sorting domain-containing protein [Membranihabitans marinus]
MNKITLLIILFSAMTTAVVAQDADYVPMFGNKATGWYQYTDFGEVGGKTTLKIYTDGDTTVNGKTYIKLLSDWYYAEEDTAYTNLSGFFREDTEERKVYSLNSSSSINPETVYYDFSKQPGDTIHIGVNTDLLLDSISTTAVVCGNTVSTGKRVFHLSNINDSNSKVIWIEGVGSIAGLSANYYNINCDVLDEGLICKMTDDEIVYHFNGFEGFEECPFEVGSSNHQQPEELVLRLYPNPAHSVLRISGDPSELGNARYRIFNLTGKMVKSGFLDHARETSLDISNLQGGAYILEIFNADKNLLTNKKVVIAQ